jgi:hypothetical protein|tara:strand:+ start:56 stop:475 length:420 start_codon:yes stop_codon:yes gene_type:complete
MIKKITHEQALKYISQYGKGWHKDFDIWKRHLLFSWKNIKKFYKGEDNWLGAFDGDELCGIYWYTITEKEMYDGFLISSKHGVGIKLGRELVERTKDKWTVNWSMCSEKYIKFNERLGFKVWSYMLIDKYKVYLLKRIQ